MSWCVVGILVQILAAVPSFRRMLHNRVAFLPTIVKIANFSGFKQCNVLIATSSLHWPVNSAMPALSYAFLFFFLP